MGNARADSHRDSTSGRKSHRHRPSEEAAWVSWPDEQLLELRFCDLDLTVEQSQVTDQIARLCRELSDRGLLFHPHFWLSDEWFTPDGVPGIAVPFYLAHPRLAQLELAQMLEVEGGTPEWCMHILRHEAGHASRARAQVGHPGGEGHTRCHDSPDGANDELSA